MAKKLFKTNIEQFKVEMKKGIDLTEEQYVLFHKKMCLEAFTRIVRRTPVDTGRARGGWQITIDNPAEGQSGLTGDQSGNQAIMIGAIEIAQLKSPFAVVYITNNVEYIVELENGSSQQAPSGMVAVTLNELASVTER